MEQLFNILKERNLYIISCHQGHTLNLGKYANEELNPYCVVRDEKEPFEKVFYAMLCKPFGIIYISTDDLEKILFAENGKRETWKYDKNKNCISNQKRKGVKYKVLHCVIMDKRTDPIIHYNNNTYDNRKCNLRYFLYKHRYFTELPPNFYVWYARNRESENIELPEHCIYIIENKTGKEYFIISNKHPVLIRKKITYEISSSKEISNENSIIVKYLQIERALIFIYNRGIHWTYEELYSFMMEK